MSFLFRFSALIPQIQTPPIAPVIPKSIGRSPGTRIKADGAGHPSQCAVRCQVLNLIEAEGCEKASGATMSSKSFQGLKEQAEGAAKDAGKEDGISLSVCRGVSFGLHLPKPKSEAILLASL